MARFDKSSTKRPKQDAAVAARRRPSARPRRRSRTRCSSRGCGATPSGCSSSWPSPSAAASCSSASAPAAPASATSSAAEAARAASRRSRAPRSRPRRTRRTSQAWRDLSTALQTDGQTDEAIDARRSRSSRSRRRTPTPSASSRASTSAQATAKQQAAQILQIQAALQRGRRARASRGCSHPPTGQPLVDDKIATTIDAQASTELQRLAGRRADSLGSGRRRPTRRSPRSQPNDPNVQLELAQAAQQAGDTATAIAAYTTLPQARSGRPERVDREAAAEAAETEPSPHPVRLARA